MKNKKDLLDALDDPDSLSQEELDAILNDPNEQEDARLLGNYRQAFVRRHASLKPDVNKEWNICQPKNRKTDAATPIVIPTHNCLPLLLLEILLCRKLFHSLFTSGFKDA